MTPITAADLKQIKLGTIIEIVDADANGYDASTDIEQETTVAWEPLAQTSVVNMSTETEDDAFEYFAIGAKVYNEEKNTAAKTTTFTATCREFTEVMYSLAYRNDGIPDDNGFYKMFTTNAVGKRVWVKMTKYDNNTGNEISVMYVFCEMKLDGDLEETNTNIRPVIAMEVIPSEFNKQKRITYLTGKAVPEAPAP